MYNFTRFEGQGPTKDNRISINRSSEITFPSAFCYENKVFSYTYTVLFWDAVSKAVGIRFTNKKDEKGIYTLKRSSKGGGARISVKGFLRASNIDPALHAGRYNWKKYEDDVLGSMYVIELEDK